VFVGIKHHFFPNMNFNYPTQIANEEDDSYDISFAPSGLAHMETGHPGPYWDKRYLPLLYEDLSFNSCSNDFDGLGGVLWGYHGRALVHSKVLDLSSDPPVERTFHWVVVDEKGVDRPEVQQKCDHVFGLMNWSNPYLWGARHNNRFKQGTKVYMIKGPRTGEHGVVVGHALGFDITARGRSIMLKVLFEDGWPNSVRQGVEVKQEHTCLVDIHGIFPMGLPHPGYSATEKREMMEKSMKERVRDDEREAKAKREFEDDVAAKMVCKASRGIE